MYYCGLCKQLQPAHTPAKPVVMEVREVIYTNPLEDGGIKESRGREIVREVRACPACLSAIKEAA